MSITRVIAMMGSAESEHVSMQAVGDSFSSSACTTSWMARNREVERK
jgi:hypothetical protein